MSILDDFFKNLSQKLKIGLHKEINDAKNDLNNAVKNAVSTSSKTIVFDQLPEDLETFKALPGADLKDPNYVAALTVLALCEYAKDEDTAIKMLNYLKGPRPLSQLELSFINDRFMDGVDYIPRSYIEGSSPDNDYTPAAPYKIIVKEFAHSRDNYNDGYIRLFIRSSGADSERFMDLRLKPSTGQWFLWEFSGMLLGIRIPKSKDEWA